MENNIIALYNYWEHVKSEKDLSRILPPTNSKRIELNKAANEILRELSKEQNAANLQKINNLK